MRFFTKPFNATTTPLQLATQSIIKKTADIGFSNHSLFPALFPMPNATVNKNKEALIGMFKTFNVTAQEMIHANSEQLKTIQRLSDDIGKMADRIGDMADKIVDTQVIQSPNFLTTQTNALGVMGVVNNSHINSPKSTSSDTFSGLISTVQESITLPILTPSSLLTIPTMILPKDSIVSAFLSFGGTMTSMIDLGAQYLNTIIKLTNDIGKMTVRIGEMSDRIVDTIELQSANLSATLSNASTPTGATETPVEQSIANTTPRDTTEVHQSNQPQLASPIDNMRMSFYSLVDGITSKTQTSEKGLSGIMAMFDSANGIVRTMIKMNTQFLKTVLVFSDEIGVMADRIGTMADQIVQMQEDLSPAFVASQEAILGSPIEDTTDTIFTSANDGLHTISDSMTIALSGIQGGSNALIAPVDMSLIGEMAVSFIGTLKGISTISPSDIHMDNIAAMFETANETVRLMGGMNDAYMSAILRLSDDIGEMANRIDDMADRIVETQVIQSENFLATQDNALTLVELMETSTSITALASFIPSTESAPVANETNTQSSISYDAIACGDATVAVVIALSHNVIL